MSDKHNHETYQFTLHAYDSVYVYSYLYLSIFSVNIADTMITFGAGSIPTHIPRNNCKDHLNIRHNSKMFNQLEDNTIVLLQALQLVLGMRQKRPFLQLHARLMPTVAFIVREDVVDITHDVR